jgi:hypothetical protein
VSRKAKLPEPFVFFVDESLGRTVVREALEKALEKGERVELPTPGTPDEVWLPDVGAKGWICLSKDRRLTTTPNELAAIINCGVALVTIGEANGAEHARRLVEALPTIRRAGRSAGLAFIARVEADGGISLRYEEGKKLATARRMKGKGRAKRDP